MRLATNGTYNMEKDAITYLEMAKIAMAMVPDEVADELDISDAEFLRLREQLEKDLNE